MSLSEEVSHIIQISTQDLHFLLKFVEDIKAYVEQQAKRYSNIEEIIDDIPEDIKPEFASFFKEFVTFLSDGLEQLTTDKEKKTETKATKAFEFSKTYSDRVHDFLFPVFQKWLRPIMYPRYLYDMALTHAITILEAFLHDFLAAIFRQRPKTLQSANMASYEEILSFSSMSALIEHLADIRAKKILSDNNIDGVADELQRRFTIDISICSGFNIIRDAFYRRHVVVHNKGITDKKYCEKIINSQVGVRLSTDYEYLATLFAAIGQLIDYLDEHFSRKMRYKRSPEVNLLLTDSQDRLQDQNN
jgi:hypothetical protein